MVTLTALSPRALTAIFWTFVSVDYVVFILRFLVLRQQRRRRNGGMSKCTRLSDYILLLGLTILTLSNIGATWLSGKREFYAKHPEKEVLVEAFGLPLGIVITQQKIQLCQMFAYYTTIWLVKSAFIASYFEFRQNLSKPLKTSLYILTGIVGATYCVNIFMNALWCRPISRAWTFDKSYCTPTESMVLIPVGAWTNIITDILLIIFPIRLLQTLHLRRSQLYALALLFTIALTTITAATVRFGILMALKKQTDQSKIFIFWQNSTLLGGLEQCLGFVAACLPAMRVLFRGSEGASTKGGSGSGSGSGSRGFLHRGAGAGSGGGSSDVGKHEESIRSASVGSETELRIVR